MARTRWLIGLLGLGVFSQAQSRRAAIQLTGHVRTFDLTAPTLDEFLIKANPTYTFSIFCATYQEREAHAITSRQGQTEQKSLSEDELYAVYAPFVPRDRFHAELYRPWDIKSGLPFFNPQHARNRTQAGIRKYKSYLRRIRHSSMFELIKRGYLMIERRPEAYDVIIKFRFDLGLKAPLVFNERWIERGLVVLPVRLHCVQINGRVGARARGRVQDRCVDGVALEI